jgi:hypothetical protein
MNLQRGVKRVTLVVSLVAGLGAWAHCAGAFFDDSCWEREQYLAYKEQYENVKWFWETWDVDGWTRDGNRMTKNDVLRALLDPPWRGVLFTRGNIRDQINPEAGSLIEFTLFARDVVPGMDAAILDLPAVALAEAIGKAREEGLSKRFWPWIEAETFWTKRTRPQLVALSAVVDLPIGIGAFITVWLVFFLMRWIVGGFCTTTALAPAGVESGNSTPMSERDVPESTQRALYSRDAKEDTAKTGSKSVIIG